MGISPAQSRVHEGGFASYRHLQKWQVVQRAHLGTVRGCTSTQRTFSRVSKGRLYSNFLSRS